MSIHTAPAHSGPPVTWFTQDRSNRKDELNAKKAENEKLECDVPGCTCKRAGMSRLCRRHADRIKSIGDPVATVPTQNELLIFKKAIDLYLKTLTPERLSEIELELDYQARQFRRPVSWAAMPSDMHHRLPQAARAEIIKAWLTKDDKDPRDFFKHALAVEGWTIVFFDGMARYRNRFIQTNTGTWATSRGTPRKDWTRLSFTEDATTIIYGPNGPYHPRIEKLWTEYQTAHISGPVKARLGREAIHAAHTAYGKSFWDCSVELTDDRQMTILDYTRLALRGANLLPPV